MKSQDYIIEKLKETSQKFPKLKFTYFADQDLKTNYIKTEPEKDFLENQSYMDYETAFIMDFIDKFPYEEITFISNNNVVDLPKKVLEISEGLFIPAQNSTSDKNQVVDYDSVLA